jgi:hypothetical protein
MGLDIRLPIGLMFTSIGLLMTIFGIFTAHSDMYERSLGINVNLWWGIVQVVFGGWMLFSALRPQKPSKD